MTLNINISTKSVKADKTDSARKKHLISKNQFHENIVYNCNNLFDIANNELYGKQIRKQ